MVSQQRGAARYVDNLSLSGQVKLVNFLEEEEAQFGRCRLITTARVDILEKVYRDELLESLYHRLATLKLSLRPLRERRADVPAIASWFCQFYARPWVGKSPSFRGCQRAPQ